MYVSVKRKIMETIGISNKLVSVIIPSYNHSQWISCAIESVLNQSYNNIELIIVDDGSTDGSHDVIHRFRDDKRVKIILNSHNIGQGNCINQGLNEAGGDYICLLPSDDWYYPDAISMLVSKFDELPNCFGIVYGPTDRYIEASGDLWHSDRRLYRGDVKSQLINDWGFVSPMSPMYRKNVLIEFPMLDGYRAEGESILFKIATKYLFDYIPEVVGVMRQHTYNTGSKHLLMAEETIRWWTDYLESDCACDYYIQRRGDILGFIYRVYGLTILRFTPEVVIARRLLINAVSVKPNYIFDMKVISAIVITFLGKTFVRFFFRVLWR